MANSPDNPASTKVEPRPSEPLRLGRWLVFYFLYLIVLAGLAGWLLHSHHMSPHLLPRSGQTFWAYLAHLPKDVVNLIAQAPEALKLVIYALYMSLSMTFLPLNTGVVVAALAMRSVGLTDDMWTTTALIAVVGAVASTMANITDYGLLRLLSQHPRVAAARNSHLYQRAERWFARQAFELLLIFNVLPVIPLDVARILAATNGYPIGRFALASLIARTIRYAVIAAVTYELGDKGWISIVALLGVAALMAAGRAVQHLVGKRNQVPVPGDQDRRNL